LSPAKELPARTHLFSVSEADTKGNIKLFVYFLTDKHRQDSWDGKSAFDFDLAKIVQTACESCGKGKPVEQIQIQFQPLGKRRYYYVSVKFAKPSGNVAVFLDLDGNIIEPEVHHFRNYQQSNEFLQSLRQK
jgi:hypothetical protein